MRLNVEDVFKNKRELIILGAEGCYWSWTNKWNSGTVERWSIGTVEQRHSEAFNCAVWKSSVVTESHTICIFASFLMIIKYGFLVSRTFWAQSWHRVEIFVCRNLNMVSDGWSRIIQCWNNFMHVTNNIILLGGQKYQTYTTYIFFI